MRVLPRLLILAVIQVIYLTAPISAAAAELRKFVMGYSTVGAMAAGMWMAKEIGAYEKYGIDAELIYISSGPTVVQALMGGDVVGGLAATNSVVAAVLRGAPMVSVLSTCNRPYHRLWVQPEIKTFDDLKGKVLGVTRFGSVTDNLTRMILKKYGLENAVSVRQMGGTIEVSSAFQNKQIAGAVTSSLRVDEKMQPRLLAKLEDVGFFYSMDVIAHARDDLKKYPNIVEGMVRAYTEGVAAMHFQKERAKGDRQVCPLERPEEDRRDLPGFDCLFGKGAAGRAGIAQLDSRLHGQKGRAIGNLRR